MVKEELGSIIHSSFGQGAAILNSMAEPTICFVGNGTPATFYEFELYSGKKIFEQQLPAGDCVWAICKTNQNEVYFCNTVDQMLYVYKEGQIHHLGTVPNNPFVFTMTCGDDYVWGGSYPNSKLFSYHITSNTFDDLGTMFNDEDYIRTITFHDNHLYMGSGSTQYFMKYNLETRQMRTLNLEGISGEKGFLDRLFFAGEYLLVSSNYTELHIFNKSTLTFIEKLPFDNLITTNHPYKSEWFVYKDGTNLCVWDAMTRQKHVIVEGKMPKGRLKAIEWIDKGDYYDLVMVTVNADVSIVKVTNSADIELAVTNSVLAITPQPIILTVMEISQSNRLYAGGYHRGLAIYNIETDKVEGNVGLFPQTEGITFHGEDVFFGTYTHAHLYRYKENTPLAFDWSAAGSPAWIGQIDGHQDRPFALTKGGKHVFFGTVPDYGMHGGALAVWDTEKNSLKTFTNVVENQSIIGLTYKNGLLYGSTGVWGGLGKPPVDEPAKIFVWDVEREQKIAEFVPNIPNFDSDIKLIGNLMVGMDGYIWGCIDGTIFCFDPENYAVLKSRVIYPTTYAHSKWRPNCLSFGTDGLLYTNVGKKLTVIHPDTLESVQLSDIPITHMTIDRQNRIYYFEGSNLYRLTLEDPLFP